MGGRHEKRDEAGKGRRIRGGEHRLRDPDYQGFTQNTFLIKESQL